MKYEKTRIIALVIMIIGLLLEIYSLLNQMQRFEVGLLIFLLGLLLSDIIAAKQLRKYRNKYGEL